MSVEYVLRKFCTEMYPSAAVRYYQYSTKYDPSWYRAWHAWAFMNFQAVLFYRGRSAASPAAGAGEAVVSGVWVRETCTCIIAVIWELLEYAVGF